MGVNSGLLVHYYKNKEEMIFALVVQLAENYANIYLAKMNEYDTPQERMDNLLTTFFEVDWTEHGDAAVFWACYSLSFRNDRVKDQFRAIYEGFRNLLAYEIQLYRGAGISKVKDPFKAADIIISMLEGVSYYNNVIGPATDIADTFQYFQAAATNLLVNGEAPQVKTK
ncbi:MAG: hypothetical protein COB54_08535 [Alphaproteobacteria bacterium]|nr:MAG: hypothetical protein COB54_08535 [Alphaproteobacteria bacterium]